jgi:hypothetical protein
MYVDYQVSRDDFINASWLALRKREVSGVFRLYYAFAFDVLMLVSAYLPFFYKLSLQEFKEDSVQALWAVGFFAVQLAFINFKFGRDYRKVTPLHLQTSLEVDGTGTHFKTSESDSRSSWQTYSKYREGKHTFLLIPRSHQYFVSHPEARAFSPADHRAPYLV